MKKYILIYAAMLCPLSMSAQGTVTDSLKEVTTVSVPTATLFADYSYSDDADYDETKVDTSLISRRNLANGFNALDYVLDHRYIPKDEKIRKGWMENLWIEGGFGIEGTTKNSNFYSFGPTSSFNIGLGKQFTPRHSARLNLLGGFSYRDTQNWFLWKLGAKADWLYDFSAHFSGFTLDRPFTVSSVMGLGVTRSKHNLNNGRGDLKSSTNFDFHAGLQFKHQMGPQAAIALEPYVGIGSNSVTKNWKGFQYFYGVNLNYIFYFDYRYSIAKQREIIRKRDLRDELAYDSTLYSWRKPSFIEFSNSLNMGASDYRKGIGNAGVGWALKAGQWLSSSIGVRATFATENFTNKEVPVEQNGETKRMFEGGNYFEARAEGLFNPFGLKKHYDWHSKCGLNLLAGMKLGLLYHNGGYSELAGDKVLKTNYLGYTVGAQAWIRLTDVVEAFVEPRFEHNIFHNRYTYVDDRNKMLDDNVLSLEFGIRVSSRSRKYVDWTIVEEKDYTQLTMKKFVLGVGGGFNYVPYQERYDVPFRFGYNGIGFAEYRFNSLHGVRLGVDWARNPSVSYYDNGEEYNICHEDFKFSLSYMLNLSNALGTINPDGRKFEAFIFGGPTLSLLFRDKLFYGSPKFTAHIGAKLLYNINEHWGIHVTPTFYALIKGVSWLGGTMTDQTDPYAVYYKLPTRSFSAIETINVGVQYAF